MSAWWCRTMHSKAMWPIHGRYICPDCHREYPVAWEAAPSAVDYRLASRSQPRAESLLDEWARNAKLLLQRAAGLKRSDTM
jgi:hypothetical protein